jgi:hypothetical protein
MAEKKSSRKGKSEAAEKDQPAASEAPVEKANPEAKAEEAKPAPAPAPVVPIRVAQVTFDRWFNAMVQKGKHKPHHKAGMLVYAGGARGRRSVDEWTKLFEKY